MENDLSLQEMQKEWHGTIRSYVVGFFASALLTMASFFLVIEKPFSRDLLIYSIIGLAIVQAAVQLILFLHIGQEDKPHWATLAFCFTILVLLIVITGSLWIMHDLDIRMMPEMTKGMTHD